MIAAPAASTYTGAAKVCSLRRRSHHCIQAPLVELSRHGDDNADAATVLHRLEYIVINENSI